jgi:hypothetical protein
MLTTSSLFCNSALLLSVHAWLHLLSLSICSSSVLLMLLGSRTVFSFHHFFSVKLMFFISAFSLSVHVVIFITYSSTCFTEKQQPPSVMTSFFYSCSHHSLHSESPMPKSGISKNAQEP